MTCPNSTESGCRCPDHDPGLGYTPPAVAVLHIVTAGPSPATPAQDAGERLLLAARRSCIVCLGDAERCRDGTGEPSFRRLPGCAAWTTDGTLTALRAEPAPRQPWEPRIAS